MMNSSAMVPRAAQYSAERKGVCARKERPFRQPSRPILNALPARWPGDRSRSSRDARNLLGVLPVDTPNAALLAAWDIRCSFRMALRMMEAF